MARVASILGSLFALVAALARAGRTDPFDRSARRIAARRLPPPADTAIHVSAWPGFPPQSRLIPPAIAALAAVALGPRAGLWQLASWGVVPAASVTKRLVERPRPLPARLRLTGRPLHGSSLPSDHVATYVSVYGFAWWLASGRDSRLAWLGGASVLPLIVLVGPSRVRMDEHWATDTVAGYLFGAAFLAALIALARHDATLRRERSGSPAERPTVSREGATMTHPRAPVGLTDDEHDGTRRTSRLRDAAAARPEVMPHVAG